MNAQNNLNHDFRNLPEYKAPTILADALVSQTTDKTMKVINLTDRINNLSNEARITYNLAVNMFNKNPINVLDMLEQETYASLPQAA